MVNISVIYQGGVRGMESGAHEGLARDRVLNELRRRLIEGQWPPDTVLQEQDLADELRVSKTPVREALLTLSARNFVKPVMRVGYVVPHISLGDLSEIFSIRGLVEIELVSALAGRRHALATKMPEDLAAWRAEYDFHEALGAFAGGSRLRRLLGELLDETARAMNHFRYSTEILPVVSEEHRAISAAAQQNDISMARALMTVHLTRMRESLMASARQKLREQNMLA